TRVLQLTTGSYRADVKDTGDVVHVLLDQGSPLAKLASIEYVPGFDGSPGTYQFWIERPAVADIALSPEIGTMTIDVDCTGRMWLASDGSTTIEVRYSDAPYDTWSAPITLASNTGAGDISVVTAMPNCTIGVLWSNQATQRFGFRSHVDGNDPANWSPDEVPAGQSALNVGGGMADNHLNVAVASDGTLYAAIKTKYNTLGLPRIGLLVRRPSGTWDPLYSVDDQGTRPIVLFNEATGHLRVAYTGRNTSGDIVYRDSPVSAIAFGNRQKLITGGSFSFASSTKQNWTDSLLVIASGGGSAVGALLTKQNQAPAVDAGPDQLLPSSSATDLAGRVGDDGLPSPPGKIVTTWSQVSGPGTASFGNASAMDTAVSFSVPGTYVLRLEAADGALTGRDEITIAVNGAPRVDAGSDQLLLTSNATKLSGEATDDGLPGAASGVTAAWTQLSGPGAATFGDVSALDTTVSFDVPGKYVLRLTATDGALADADDVTITVNGPPTAKAGPDQTLLTDATTSLHGRVKDDGVPEGVTAAWTLVHGPGSVTFDDASAADTTATFSQPGNYVLRLSASDGALTDTNDVMIMVNAAPLVGAGEDQIVLDSMTAQLHGTVSDDAIPNLPGGAQSRWSKLSGPGTVTFGDATTLDTTATFSMPGSYLIRLTGNDGALVASDDVAITINAPPVVNAGDDQIIPLGSVASLHGTTADDGVANPPGTLNTTWTTVSGPGMVSFSNPGAPGLDTTATFTMSGNYVLRLTASDGTLANTDDVLVTVNAPPKVAAGPDQIVLDSMAAHLHATTTDDGLPNPPGRTRTMWTAVSGPGTATFTDTATADTIASFNMPGSYVLRITADDGAAAVSDDVTITVNAGPSVDAGADQTVLQPDGANLYGTAGDDGVGSSPSGLATTWTQVSGPATVSFGNPSDRNSTVSFSKPGNYVLQLSATDGVLTASDTVTITVKLPPPPVVTLFQDGVFPTAGYTGTQDTWIRTNSTAGKNFGSTTTLTADGRTDAAVLLKWDISSIPSGSTVQSAMITINVTDPPVDRFDIFAMNRAWSEMSATWKGDSATSNWELAGAMGASDHGSTVLASITSKNRGLVTVPLNPAGLALVQSWVDHPSSNLGIIVQNYATSDGLDFSSSEATAKRSRPRLMVTYVSQDLTNADHALSLDPSTLPPTIRVGPKLTAPALARIAAEARSRWAAAGLDAGLVDVLSRVQMEIMDLPDLGLTLTSANVIKIDPDAAGLGWFIDRTASNDREFRNPGMHAARGSGAYGHVDLLTAIAHEFGHVLGLDDSGMPELGQGLMTESLGINVRRVPTTGEVDDVMASGPLTDLLFSV
ncbi:MAG: PKD domain-containing protein, partial [Planctomycetes bacterium]|nr:PKD domain-containing protein [Planctomycetota bacterium]